MKVYVDFEELDVEDKPTYICNKYNLQVRSINSGSDYKNVELVNIADYTKQVRKEVIEQVYKVLEQAVPKDLSWSWAVITKELDKLQGE